MIKEIGKILTLLKEYKKPTIISMATLSIQVILEVLLPYIIALIIDRGVMESNITAIVQYGLLMLLCTVLSLLIGIYSKRQSSLAATGFAKNIRKEVFYNIQNFSFNNIDKYSSSSLITRLTTDVTNIQNSYMMILMIIVRSPLSLIMALFLTFTISPRLSVVYLVASLFLGVILYFLLSHAIPTFNKTFEQYDKLNASIQENINNIRDVKAYVQESKEIEKFSFASYSLYRMFKKAESIVVINSPVMQFTMYGAIIAISFLGANYIVDGSMAIGELSSVLSYTTNIMMSLMMFSMIFVLLSISIASIKRVNAIIDEIPTLTNPDKPITAIKDGSISFENVNFSYFGNLDNLSLKNINLDIQSGQTIGIIGGTGSSKSTLVQLVSRLYDVTSGSLKVGGVDVKDYDIKSLRDNVAVVLQKNVLFTGTIADNIRWGKPDASIEEIEEVCRIAQAEEFISRMPDGYQSKIERGGVNVSGGQKQRLTIARALIKNPKILILDDSTSAVDTATDHLIQEGFKNRIKETTKIIIAQRISSVQNADKIIVMDDGQIESMGTHAQLLEISPIYQDVYNTQIKGGIEDEK
ncbi:MAG: ABC transporter ATP-binding protein [Erysipelotrichaceae bacterium]|nr:ABC transporter ATP-binding protein [Erysipelotrichaceae bacterium]